MSGSLYLKYNATDDGSRTPTNPIPPNTDFWDGNAVSLATTGNIYTIGQNAPIEVQVSLKPEAPAYEIINVEVWVCDPTTVAGPSTALPPYQGAANGTALTGFCIPADGSVPIVHVPTAPDTTYFKPYPGISNLPGGHCCLIANCYGTTSDGMSDGASLASSAASLPSLVQTDQHVAQRNIFASTSQNMKIIFPFRAATPLGEGAERVRLDIVETSPAELETILHAREGELQGAQFTGLPLAVSQLPPKSARMSRGLPRRRCCRWLGWCCKWLQRWCAKEGPIIDLELKAHESKVLTLTVELDPAEKPGAAHAFDIVQKDAQGRIQGGFRLVTVAKH